MDSVSNLKSTNFQNNNDPKESVEEAVLRYVGVDLKNHIKKTKKKLKKQKKRKHGSKMSHEDEDTDMDWYLKHRVQKIYVKWMISNQILFSL